MTFEEYLRANTWPNKKGVDHSLRAQANEDGSIEFYIHPSNESGDTADFTVKGNVLAPRFSGHTA
jgi:hypothetical protein